LAFIADVKFIIQGSLTSSTGSCWVIWSDTEDLPSGLSLEYTLNSEDTNYDGHDFILNNSASNEYISSERYLDDELTFTYTSLTLNAYDSLLGTYENISDISLFGEVDDVIFRKTIT
jgi:hypothetical protein